MGTLGPSHGGVPNRGDSERGCWGWRIRANIWRVWSGSLEFQSPGWRPWARGWAEMRRPRAQRGGEGSTSTWKPQQDTGTGLCCRSRGLNGPQVGVSWGLGCLWRTHKTPWEASACGRLSSSKAVATTPSEKASPAPTRGRQSWSSSGLKDRAQEKQAFPAAPGPSFLSCQNHSTGGHLA